MSSAFSHLSRQQQIDLCISEIPAQARFVSEEGVDPMDGLIHSVRALSELYRRHIGEAAPAERTLPTDGERVTFVVRDSHTGWFAGGDFWIAGGWHWPPDRVASWNPTP